MKRSFLSIILALSLILASTHFMGCKKRKHDHHGHDHKDHKHDDHEHKGHKRTNKKGNKHKNHKHEKTQAWLVPAYEKIRKALAADQLKVSQASAKVFATKASQNKSQDKKEFQALSLAAKKLSQSKDLKNARLSFGALSKALISLLHEHKGTKGLQAYQCPMAKGYKKWIQADVKMANPYMGKKMLKCGGKTAFKP